MPPPTSNSHTLLVTKFLLLLLTFITVPSTASYSSVLSTNPNPNDPPQNHTISTTRNICYIHVGKSGGHSLIKFLKHAIRNGDLGNSMQVHGVRQFITPDYVAHHPPFSVDYHKGKTGRIGTFDSIHDGMVRTWRTAWPPVSRSWSMQECVAMDVVLWIRDPVTRLISTWNFLNHYQFPNVRKITYEKGYIATNDTDIDLNTLLETMAKNELESGDSIGEDLLAILSRIAHATTDIAFYLGTVEEFPTLQKTRSTTCEQVLKVLPIWFVGRTEHFEEDYELFLAKTVVTHRRYLYPMPHTHVTQKQGTSLSLESVSFLRRFFQVDYECILQLVHMGWIDMDYYDSILMNNTYVY